MTEATDTEWGVAWAPDPHIAHRWSLTEHEARQWVWEFEADGGRAGSYIVISRLVGQWGPAL